MAVLIHILLTSYPYYEGLALTITDKNLEGLRKNGIMKTNRVGYRSEH